MKALGMTVTAFFAILCTIYLRVYGSWTTLIIDLILIILFCIAVYKSSRVWKYWIGMVLLTTYLLSFAGLRVRQNAEGRTHLVNALYPFCPKVYIEGTSIEAIELATGYSTFAGWFYNVQKSKFYAVKDTNQLMTICCNPEGSMVIQGRQMNIEEYKGSHGNINVFSYLDEKGKRVRRDFYGKNVDDESYTVHIFDNADYIPDYVP